MNLSIPGDCHTKRALSLLALVAFAAGSAFGQARLSPPVEYSGACDASAVVALGSDHFAVANDEDNLLRTYNRTHGGPPVQTLDLTKFLELNPKAPESDLEAAATLGDRAYWITSHGRNRKGRKTPNRHRFFATRYVTNGTQIALEPVGRPYTQLLRDLTREPSLLQFKLATAATRAPKTNDALNIEGLCSTPDNHLLIGFRNPIPGGKALIVPLLNPADLTEGKPAKFGAHMLLDLNGLGIRSMGYWRGHYVILAGSYQNDAISRLYTWDGGTSAPKWIEEIKLGGLNPEGVAFYGGTGPEEFHIVSDDGTLSVGGMDCKKLTDPALRRFRSYQVVLGSD